MIELLKLEIEVLKPTTIWFQGKSQAPKFYQDLANKGPAVIVAHHPSYYQRKVKIGDLETYATRPEYIEAVVNNAEGEYRKYTKQ